MIYGIGIDVVSLDRLASLCKANQNLLQGDLFSVGELHDAGVDSSEAGLTDEQTRILASKFAAKEATVKAIGLPHDVSFNWSDIVVWGDATISIETCHNIEKYAKKIGITSLRGSVSTSKSYSMAIVIGESK